MAIGETMQKFRNQAGLSQSDLAEKTGLSMRSIQNWEQGHRTPNAQALLALARVLKVPVETLIKELDKASPERTSKRRGHPKKTK